ncbi:MAG TPA: arginine--tRNA ligase [Acidimicrobiia bacterium]
MIRDDLAAAVRAALGDAGLPEPAGGVELTPPKAKEHGDFATNVALQLAKAVGRPPREVAQSLAAALMASAPAHLERVEIAGPGFLNLHLGPGWLHDVLRTVVTEGEAYGRNASLAGRRINLEFVSVNPTGPLHAGGGRWVAVGDAIANLLAAQGALVHREYLLNDAGTQLDLFGRSLLARYQGEEPPDDGYQGAYLDDMATRLRADLGDDVTFEQAREWGYQDVVREVKADLERIGVQFDTWFSERVLHQRGEVADVVATLEAKGVVEDRDGARWLRSTDFGDSRDRVLIRRDGTPTYLCADLAYHRDKWRRGFEHLIDIWGADHHAQVPSLQAGMQALGYPPGSPEVILGQFVTLMRGGQPVRMSKRAGDLITLADILDEVDPDVARFTFLLQSIDTTQSFDLDVVTAQSMENPVYYVQYAHARIASIGRQAAERGVERRPLDDVDLSVLVGERELDLLRSLAAYPDVVADAARLRAPHRVATWVRELAGRFHGFYRDCRVLGPVPGGPGDPIDAGLTQARLWLVEACRVGLADALGLLGVSAPERMDRGPEEPGAPGVSPEEPE